MTEIVTTVASKAAEYLVAPVGRQCGYVIFTNSYVSQLKDELEELNYARQRVQHSIDEALNNMKRIEGDVMKWVKDAETVAKNARDVIDDDGRAKKTCFYGWLPNPKARYCLGRDARKTAQAIQPLIPQSKFERVCYESAPPGLVGGAPNVNSSACDGGDTIQELIARGQFEKVDFENLPTVLVGGTSGVNSSAGDGGDFITGSRASIFQDIMKALDDEKLKVIGVYGPGGVGKTTLLKEVEKKLGEAGRPSRMIVKVRVSQIPDLNNIVDQIADAFGLELKDKLSPQGKADVLSKRLKSNPDEKVLLIFDDLWVKLDLEAVGIPLGDVSSKCKLLLTSRFKDVLEQEMGADRTFPLRGLTDDEASRLFENKVGDKLKDNEELKSIADQVVKKLAGLPLLIISVANTLKSSDESAWRNALIEIDESSKKTTEMIVRMSYEHLKSEDAKYLFLLCGLIGGIIPVELLFVLAMGLGLFERFNKTLPALRDRLNNTLNELRSACLLLDGGDDKDSVTIHDLYSEVVVSTPFQDQNSLMMNNNYGASSKEELGKCWAICLDDDGTNRLAELMMCQFPSLKILMLSMPKVWDWSEEHQHDMGDCSGLLDFRGMKELQVLYLRFMHITNLPPSIEILGNLRSLYLYKCDVKDVAIIGKLKALQILSFEQSTISRLPKEIGELTNLRSLNLSNCYRLETIEPGVLEGLIKLEELQMKSSFDQWIGMDEISSESCNARLAELKSLTRLTTMEISIPNPTILLENGDLPVGNLIKFWFNIGNVMGREFQGLTTMKLKLKGCGSILSKDWVQETLQKTQYLHLDGLDGLRGFNKNAHKLCVRGFTQLKHLNIQNSPSIEYIASSSSDLATAFTMLESLFLENLDNLEKLCNGPLAPNCFSRLKAMHIKKCHRLENLWFQSKMQGLVHLEEIHICECDSLQAIITYDAGKVEVAADDMVKLPNVRCLDLQQLPNMTSFCTGVKGAPIQVLLPRLKSLIMVGFFGLEKILYSEPSLKYSNLKWLKIKESKSTSIIPKDWILKLSNLDSMGIVHSPSAEVVFDLEELKVTKDAEILSWLMQLELSELPNLQRMWKQDGQLQGISIFRNLERLFIKNIGLSFLFPVSMAKCLTKIRDIEVDGCPNMKAVIVDEEGTYDARDDIIKFPFLEQLSISRCPIEKFFSYPHGKKESITTTSDSQDNYPHSFFDQKISLPNLKELILRSGSFKSIWHSELSKSSVDKLANLTLKQDLQSQGISIFQNLKVLSINNTGLSFLFPMSMAKCLTEIRDIEVKDCPNMKAVIVDEEGTDDGRDDIIEFRSLERLSISRCPMEKFFSYPYGKKESITTTSDSQDNYPHSFFDRKISLPNLEELVLRSVGSFKSIWHSELPTSSSDKLANLALKQDLQSQGISINQNLKVLSINNTGLSFLFSVSMAKRLREIRDIKVEDCPNMKAVIVDEEGTYDGRDDIIEFRSLERLSISRCPTEKFLSYSHGKKESITTASDSQDNYPHSFFDQKICLPNLEKLILLSVGSFKSIWHSELPTSSSNKLANLALKQDLQSHGISINQNLKVLSINNTGLSFLFSVSMAKRLREIKDIEVEDCPNMKAVIVDEEGTYDGRDDIIKFPLLERLSISHCPTEKFFSYPHGKRESITTTSDSQDNYSHSFFDQKISLPNMEELILRSVGSGLSCLFLVSMAKCLSKIRDIEVKDCPNMKAVIVDEEGTDDGRDGIIELPLLERLSITCCPMEKFFSYLHGKKESITTTSDSQDNYSHSFFDQKISLPSLEKLVIKSVGSLKRIWHSELPKSSFDKLANLTLKKCSNLLDVFPSTIMGRLHNLEIVKVSGCPSLESLFDLGSLDSYTKQTIVLLPELEEIMVLSCPSLESLFNWGPLDSSIEHKIVLLPKLEGVAVSGAGRLRHVVMSDSQTVLGFPSLKLVFVYNCSELRYLFPNYMATTLAKLNILVISKCEQMKEVVPKEECGRSKAEVMSFHSLTSLVIWRCPNFREFIPTSAERQLGKMIEENDEFPSVDVSSRTKPDQGNQSAKESEGEIEDLDLRIEELEREIEEE